MTNGPERMRQAGKNLEKIKRIIEEGRAGNQVTFPLSEAALTLRIPRGVLENLEKKGRTLGVTVEKKMATVKLEGSASQQKEAYSFLYGFVQSFKGGRANLFLKTQKAPPLLAEENPDLEEILAVVEKGKCDLPDEDLAALHLQLWGRWQSLTDKNDLFPPQKVFN